MAAKAELEESSEYFLENDDDFEGGSNKEEDGHSDEEGSDVEAQISPSSSPFSSHQWPQSFR